MWGPEVLRRPWPGTAVLEYKTSNVRPLTAERGLPSVVDLQPPTCPTLLARADGTCTPPLPISAISRRAFTNVAASGCLQGVSAPTEPHSQSNRDVGGARMFT